MKNTYVFGSDSSDALCGMACILPEVKGALISFSSASALYTRLDNLLAKNPSRNKKVYVLDLPIDAQNAKKLKPILDRYYMKGCTFYYYGHHDIPAETIDMHFEKCVINPDKSTSEIVYQELKCGINPIIPAIGSINDFVFTLPE